MTPRAIPFDGPFLEKPPLKMWIVAGLIKTGVVPHDERGLRFADALLGAIAFVYVYAIGRLLAGPLCGVVAVFVLFTFGPLLFVHGVRSNNMESAMLLAYAAGLYHFTRWDSLREARSRRGSAHAFAVGAYFAFGFMTKFVAVFFLPLICALALLWRSRRARPSVGELVRAWTGPALLAIALCAPWFVAAYRVHGPLLWNVMLGDHVYTRFTGSLDPAHLAPWTAYLEWIWGDLVLARSAWFVVAGLVLLLVWALTGRPEPLKEAPHIGEGRPTNVARLVLVWLAVPIALMSMGSSKLPHYAFPFLPPLGLAAGYLVASLVAVLTGPLAAIDFKRVRAAMAAGHLSRGLAFVRGALVVAATAALVVAVWTALDGRLAWGVGGRQILSNTSIVRPLVLGAFLLWLGAAPLSNLHAWVVVPLMVLVMAPAYEHVVDRLRHPNHPLQTLRACAHEIQRTNPDAGRTVYNAAHTGVSHPYFYYLRSIGPWTFADAPAAEDVRQRLLAPSPSPILVSREGFGALVVALGSRDKREPEVARASFDDEPIDSRQTAVTGVTDRDGHIIVVLPGPYQACVPPAAAAGWIAVGDGTTTRDDR